MCYATLARLDPLSTFSKCEDAASTTGDIDQRDTTILNYTKLLT